MNQAQVRDIYLRVIDATVEGVHAELAEKGESEEAIESLSLLKARWSTRYVRTHDFTDDPTVADMPPWPVRRAKKMGKPPAKIAPKKNVSQSPDGATVADLTSGPEECKDQGHPSAPLNTKGLETQERTTEVTEVKDGERPAKRQRIADDDGDGKEVNETEDLDSSDSDDNGSDDEVADHLILARHEKVKKGNPKWKVILREGVVCIRGREYLFNKATCDLEF